MSGNSCPTVQPEGTSDLDPADPSVAKTSLQISNSGSIMPTRTIDWFPPEILLSIFECVIHLDLVADDGYGEVQRRCMGHARMVSRTLYGSTYVPTITPYGLTRFPTHALHGLTHVCKRWREVALNCPTLWTNIDNRVPAQMDAFFVRSRAAPISINLISRNFGDLASIMYRHGSRIKRLDVTVHKMVPSSRQPRLRCAVPLLECLTMVSTDNEAPLRLHDNAMAILDACNFGVKALALINVIPGVPRLALPQLTHLYLSGGSRTAVWGDAMHHLPAILAHTPALQHLHISNLRHRTTQADMSDAMQPVALPALRSLTCSKGWVTSALRLLELLELPENVLVRLDSLECQSPNTVIRSYALSPQTLAWLSSFTYLEVMSHNHDTLLIAHGSRPHSGLWIQAMCHNLMVDWVQWLTQLTTMFPLPSVTSLKISWHDEDLVRSLFRQFPLVTELVAYFNHEWMPGEGDCERVASDLYAALSEGNPPSCPRLETLILSYDAIPTALCIPQLVDAIALRKALGYPLRRFTIDTGHQHCKSEEDELQSTLRRVKAHVLESSDLSFGTGAFEFKMDERWTIPEAERWWQLPNDEKAANVFPIYGFEPRW
ncbi:hypothetical protein ONZ51_g4328 [Trametes cubensis]|uniref:F-box domain-containing protein n=1 Tax=Trametes cubensis TaxID=1111947 RepID=A0AAD7TWA4_9APHY|nr:hypothetical protein ONZ51_g4328 [Trametes cubensis]